MDIKDYLYAYIAEDLSGNLQSDGAYQQARQIRNTMQRELVEALTMKQRRMFHAYMEQENYLSGLEQRRIFREALSLHHSIYSAPPSIPAESPDRTCG